jgi:hypothetical protein
MIIMVGHTPAWLCDVCKWPIAVDSGFAVYSQASRQGHFPTPQLVCGAACATIAQASLTVQPVQRLPFQAFLTALTGVEGRPCAT